ncbi:hypothetical protein [Vreelandella titanicae]|uniref:hypothetical protein n=1 Tax=Vreelandella titanicae TaxID=664683 RepID=UPI001142E0F2|nr:hypothetical protein [Halomonas titanicae]
MNISDAEIISAPKSYDGELSYSEKTNNRAFQVISFRPEDEMGITLPGVTIEICLRTPLVIDECKYTFTIFRLKGQKRERIYQLEVVPSEKKSHNGPPKTYGPHVHIGDSVQEVNIDLCCEDYQDWLAWFCEQVNLTLTYEPPSPFGNKDGLQLAND